MCVYIYIYAWFFLNVYFALYVVKVFFFLRVYHSTVSNREIVIYNEINIE